LTPRLGLAAATWRMRVARLSPVPSSGFLPLSTVLAAFAARTSPSRSPPFAVTPRRFAALFHAARVPGVALQSFPFSRSRARSRGPLLPCGFAFDRPTARQTRGIRGSYPRRADLWPRRARRHAGLGGRDDGSPEPLVVVRSARGAPGNVTPWIYRARRTRRPARPLRSLAPLESPFSWRPPPWPGDDRPVGALLGLLFPSRACSGIPWVRHARGRVRSGRARASRIPESPVPGHAYSPGPCSGRGA